MRFLQGVKSKCLLASASCVSASESSNVSLLCKDVAGCRGGSDVGPLSARLCHAVVLQDGGIHPRLVEVCLEAPQDSLMRHSHRAVASSSPSSSSADFFTPRQLRLCLLAQNPPLPRGVVPPSLLLALPLVLFLSLLHPSLCFLPPPTHTHTPPSLTSFLLPCLLPCLHSASRPRSLPQPPPTASSHHSQHHAEGRKGLSPSQ